MTAETYLAKVTKYHSGASIDWTIVFVCSIVVMLYAEDVIPSKLLASLVIMAMVPVAFLLLCRVVGAWCLYAEVRKFRPLEPGAPDTTQPLTDNERTIIDGFGKRLQSRRESLIDIESFRVPKPQLRRILLTAYRTAKDHDRDWYQVLYLSLVYLLPTAPGMDHLAHDLIAAELRVLNADLAGA